jgi:exonuclease VII small subunit
MTVITPPDDTHDGDGIWWKGKWHQNIEGIQVSAERDVNEAIATADFAYDASYETHCLKVLAQAVRSLRRELAPLGSAQQVYQRGWDAAARLYCQELERRPSVDQRSTVNQELLEAARAQHNAIDILFARLIMLSGRHTPEEPFFPSTSGLPWEAMMRGQAAIEAAEKALKVLSEAHDKSPPRSPP